MQYPVWFRTRHVFYVTLIVVALTILSVYLFGLGVHHTFYENSLWSTTLISLFMLGFAWWGLYRGISFREDTLVSKGRAKSLNPIDYVPVDLSSFDGDADVGESGCLGVIVSILLWLVAAVVVALLLWLFSAVVYAGVLAFMSMLYWIFLRALKMIFTHTPRCRGNVWESLKIAAGYTLLYNCWIYGIFLIIAWWK